MRVLLLGGTGTIGEPLTRLLSNEGNEVWVTSRKEHSNYDNIHYIIADAMEDSELDRIIGIVGRPDCIVDFMNYSTIAFEKRYQMLLKATKKYVFVSSCRVFSPSSKPIDESGDRLLDSTIDKGLLNSKEYSIEKARQEDCLYSSGCYNYAIVRPYITYSTQRLQLGGLEKEDWLYRAINGKKIVIPQSVMNCYTSLTYANDVATKLVSIIHSDEEKSVYNIVSPAVIKWKDVLEIYDDVLRTHVQNYQGFIMADKGFERLMRIQGKLYQHMYDRNCNRIFKSKEDKINPRFEFTSAKEGLTECLVKIINDSESIRAGDICYQAWADKISGERKMPKGISKKTGLLYFLISKTSIGIYIIDFYRSIVRKLRHN